MMYKICRTHKQPCDSQLQLKYIVSMVLLGEQECCDYKLCPLKYSNQCAYVSCYCLCIITFSVCNNTCFCNMHLQQLYFMVKLPAVSKLLYMLYCSCHQLGQGAFNNHTVASSSNVSESHHLVGCSLQPCAHVLIEPSACVCQYEVGYVPVNLSVRC